MTNTKFDILYESIIKEMNENSFYPAKYIDGDQAVGKDFNGRSQIWMIGPTTEKSTIDFFSGEKLPYMTTVLWLPNKKGPRKGIAVSIDSYEKFKTDPRMEEIGLVKEIDWENA